jgi:hypothetical protein
VGSVSNDDDGGDGLDERGSWLRRRGEWFSENVAKTVLTTLVGLVVVAVVGLVVTLVTGGAPPPISQQIDEIREHAADDGYLTEINRPVELRGGGTPSRLFVFRPERGAQNPVAGDSDEIRVYDEKDQRLHLTFQFQPKNDPVPYRFRVEGAGKFDETDRDEVIGEYVADYVDRTIPYPVALIWSETDGGYALRSLLPREPRLVHVPNPGSYEVTARRGYRQAVLRDVESGRQLPVYGVDLFAVRRKPFPILAASFTVQAPCNACPRTVQVKAWHLDFEQPKPASFACSVPPVLFRPKRFFNPVAIWVERAPHEGLFC